MTFKYFPNVIGIINSVNEPYGLCKHRDNPGTLTYVSLIWKACENSGKQMESCQRNHCHLEEEAWPCGSVISKGTADSRFPPYTTVSNESSFWNLNIKNIYQLLYHTFIRPDESHVCTISLVKDFELWQENLTVLCDFKLESFSLGKNKVYLTCFCFSLL